MHYNSIVDKCWIIVPIIYLAICRDWGWGTILDIGPVVLLMLCYIYLYNIYKDVIKISYAIILKKLFGNSHTDEAKLPLTTQFKNRYL